jgi:hypothetical protein
MLPEALNASPSIFQSKRESLCSLLLGNKGTAASNATAISNSFKRASEGGGFAFKLAFLDKTRVREASVMPARRDKSNNALQVGWFQDLLLCCFALPLTSGALCFNDFLKGGTRNERLAIAYTA